MNDKPKDNSIGALWKKTSVKGQDYYTGNIKIDDKEVQIVVFENKSDNEKAPTLKIYRNEKKLEK